MKVNVDGDLARMMGKEGRFKISRNVDEDNYLNLESDLLAVLL